MVLNNGRNIITDMEATTQITQVGKPGQNTLAAPTNWSLYLANFIASQDVRESSRKLYARTLKLFFQWVDESGKSLNELTRADILRYKDELLAAGLSGLTVGSYLTAIRKFYEWAEGEKIYPNIGKGIRTPRRVQAFKKQHLTDTKSRALLKYYEQTSPRDYAMVNLMLRTGLRTVEVIRANVGDITFKGGRRILKVWGKGHTEKDAFVILSDKAFLPLFNYLQTRRGAKDNAPLFASDSPRNTGERLTTRSISRICKNGLKAIGLDGKEFTAHSLRHTTAVSILKHGGDISAAQAVLRHTTPTTTQIYIASIKEELRLQKAPELLIDNAF